MDVTKTLKVDGYIQANSLDLNGARNGGSGGSGGSILIDTGNFTGKFIGFSEVHFFPSLLNSNYVQAQGQYSVFVR